MRARCWALAGLVALALAGCGAESETAANSSDPEAGSWKTWVLSSAGDTSVPAPPKGDTSKLLKPDVHPAVEPWLQEAMTLVSQRPKDPVTASRNYALLGVGMYDAAVAAAHWQAKYGHKGYPSIDAAIAGAGSRVIASTFTETPAAQLDADADATVARLVSAGVSKPAATAGLQLGRGVAAKVADVASHDGSDRVWHGKLPTFRGAWRPPPGSAARPVSPLAGTWKTWVLKTGHDVRPGPPPKYGSKAFLAQAQAVKRIGDNLTQEQKRIAKFWAGGEGTELPPGRWIKVTLEYLRHRPALSEPRVARMFALETVAMDDAGIAAWDAKYKYWLARPENAIRDLIDPSWRPYLDTPFFPSYTSGHAVYSGAAAEVMAYLFPEDAGIWRGRAREAAKSREYGGIHYPIDDDVGIEMGIKVGKLVVARAEKDGADR